MRREDNGRDPSSGRGVQTTVEIQVKRGQDQAQGGEDRQQWISQLREGRKDNSEDPSTGWGGETTVEILVQAGEFRQGQTTSEILVQGGQDIQQ